MKNIFLNILFILVICGCVTSRTILAKESMENLYSVNEISKEKTIEIAKQYCLAVPVCHKNCSLSSIKIAEDAKWFPGQWIASFKSKQWSTLGHRFYIFIDKKTGKVINSDWTD